MKLHIRAVTPDDAGGIVAIVNPIIVADRFTTFTEPFSIETERAYILSMTNRHLFHVAVDAATERIVGFQSLGPFPGFSRSFDHVAMIGTYVDLSQRRQGIASQLFPVTFARAKAIGYEKLFTYVRADNPGALATYVSQGFNVVGTAARHAKINGHYIDEIMIERLL